MAQQRDVAIVGAGPVGFLVAFGLARQGIDVTLLDGAEGIVNSPRAALRKSMDGPSTAQMAAVISRRIMGDPLPPGQLARV